MKLCAAHIWGEGGGSGRKENWMQNFGKETGRKTGPGFYDITAGLKELVWVTVHWIHLDNDTDKLRTVVNTVMNPGFKNEGNLWVDEELTFWRTLIFKELSIKLEVYIETLELQMWIAHACCECPPPLPLSLCYIAIMFEVPVDVTSSPGYSWC